MSWRWKPSSARGLAAWSRCSANRTSIFARRSPRSNGGARIRFWIESMGRSVSCSAPVYSPRVNPRSKRSLQPRNTISIPFGSNCTNPAAATPRCNTRLLSAVETAFGPARRLIIVPDGALAYLPFETLGGKTRMIERFAIGYAPSASVLAALRSRSEGSSKPSRILIAFGDPVYTARGFDFTRLPNTRAEVTAIRSLYPADASRVYLGAEASEGVMGLGRAFLFAGADSLLISLWNMNDASTATLMKRVYENINRGLPRDEALRQAKLSLLRSQEAVWRHPYYWAPFVLLGNP